MPSMRTWPFTRRDTGPPAEHNGHDPGPPDAGLLAEAGRFISLFHTENPSAGPPGPRLAQVREEITLTGT